MTSENDFFEPLLGCGLLILGVGIVWFKTDWVVALSAACLVLSLILLIGYYVRTLHRVSIREITSIKERLSAE